MQTAVEWFFRWVNDNPEATHKEYSEAFKQAKEMEKQQLNIARIDGINLANKGYGSKGSDDKKINLVEIPQEQLEKERNPNYKYFDTSSQTEISDEEIWTKANEIGKTTNSSIAAQYLYEGAKWYREQLKSRQ